MDFSSDDSSCSDFDEDPDTMEVPDIDISIASTIKNHNYLDGDTNNNPYSQIEAENVLDEVEEFSTPPITENNEHEIETEEETQPVVENTKNHTLPQRLPPTTSRNISVCINGRMIKLDTRNAVLVTPELLKSMGGLEGTNVNRAVINNVSRFNGSSARVNNNQPVTDRIPHQVLVNNNSNTTESSSEQSVLVNSNGAIPRLDFRNGFQIRLPSQRSTGSSAHVNNTQPVTDQTSHQVLVNNRITTESSTEQGVLVNSNGAIPRLDYRNGFRIEPPSPRLTGQSIPGGRRILTIDGIIDTVDDDISDPPTLTQQPTQRTISRVQLPQSGRILRRVAIMRPRGYSESTSPNRTVRYSAVNGRQMIPNRRLPPTTTTFGSLAHFRAHAQGQGIRTIRIVRPGESLYSRIKLQSRAQGASLTNGRITNGTQFRNSTVLDIQRTLESQGITDQSVARFVQKHMEQNHLKRKLVTHDHDYNSTKKQKKEIMEEVENEMELGVAETYSTYMPAKLGIGEKHPDPVVETASLSSVAPVDVWYELSIPHGIIENGTLSALQLESITYAAQAHEQILPDKTRAGYLIGDGAGVGKGRTIAGLILENFSKGRRRAVWVSISNDLKFDAERDLQDVGAGYIQVHRLNKMKYSHKISSESNGRNREGVLFCTYSSLIGESNAAEGKYTNRKSQIVQWCGKNFEGLLIFDECHKAKNLCPSGSMKSTKTGQMVLELQASLPNARVLYASATGASEPRNMAYMTRLGLWGKGTTFQTFEDFATAVEEKGVGGMEIVAMDMKLRGMYIARQLSFQDVKFTIVEVQMSKEFIKVYDESVDLWVDAMFKFLKAADLVDGNGNMRKTMNGQYWSTHQRFFKYLCIAAKVEEAIRLAHDAMKNNRCVVIGLQSTGEAGTLDQLEKGDGTLTDFVSTCKGVFQNLVEKHFPSSNQDNVNKILSNLSVAQKNIQEEKEMMKRKQRELLQMDSDLELSDDDSDHEPKEQERKMTKAEIDAQKESEVLENIFKKKHGAHVFEEKYEDRKLKKKETEKEKENKPKKPTIEDIEKANEMKRELLSRIEKLGEKLPKNTLDDLIDNLGGAEQVAEMTGRKGRVVQTENGIQYVSRSEQDVPLETLNVKEKERFMDGRKLVAIISEAASSGISLQSDKRALNKRKRYHITLELPWSADKAVQQFGRTHRSNQVSAPEYVFLITNLAGERRFASTVAKRLESLGALTHGDRRAADNRDLSQFNIDNKYGKNALETVMKSILSRESPFIGPPRDYKGDFFQDCTDALIGVGLIIRDPSRGTLTLDKDYSNISKFLNRILGIRVELQNRLFKYFTDTMNAMIAIAKRNGTFDLGILDLGANSRDVIKRVRTITFLYKHPTGVAPIELHKLVVERGLSWKEALQKFEEEASEQHEGFYASRHGNRGRHLVILLIKVERPTGRRGTYETDDKLALYRPNTGKQNQLVTLAEIEHKYYKTDAKEVQNLWEEQYNCTICSHLYMNGDCRSGSNCENGLRRRTYHVLAGAVLPIWLKIEKAIADKSNEEDNEKENKKENRKEKNKMQVIRVKTVDNMKIVGTLIKNHLVDGLVKVLTQEAESVKDEDFPEE